MSIGLPLVIIVLPVFLGWTALLNASPSNHAGGKSEDVKLLSGTCVLKSVTMV